MTARSPKTFDKYFRMIDVATMIALLILAIELMPDRIIDGLPVAVQTSVALMYIGGSILMLVVAFARSMRDEFAEQCWRGAASTTVKTFAFAPMIAMFVAGLVDGFAEAHRPGTSGGGFGRIDALDMMSAVWAIGLAVYFLAFQYHRWQASQ